MASETDTINVSIYRERTGRALKSLEKLKSSVSAIESRYDILQTDYSAILDDAISRVSTAQSELVNNNSPKSPSGGGLQHAVDIVGDAIELGLDKIGDGIILPMDGLVKLVSMLRKP